MEEEDKLNLSSLSTHQFKEKLKKNGIQFEENSTHRLTIDNDGSELEIDLFIMSKAAHDLKEYVQNSKSLNIEPEVNMTMETFNSISEGIASLPKLTEFSRKHKISMF